MQEIKFFRCNKCGNFLGMIHDGGAKMICCGEPMELVVPGKVDASQEKHVPVIAVDGDLVTVKVGSEVHPMLSNHYIEWIYIATEKGGQRKRLNPGDEPVASFKLTEDDKLLAAYEYCNLHGLWMANA